jgi:hypothetical protein
MSTSRTGVVGAGLGLARADLSFVEQAVPEITARPVP